jgi:Intracellular proteinase inhibitor
MTALSHAGCGHRLAADSTSMRSATIKLASILLASATIVGGCHPRAAPQRPASTAPVPESDADVGEILVSTEVSPAEIAPGQLVFIRVRVTNPTSHAVTLDFDSGCQAYFVVRDSTGRTVSTQPQNLACAPQATKIRLLPWQSRTVRFTWDGRVYTPSPGAPDTLPPGKYEIVGVLTPPAGLKATPATVRLRPKQVQKQATQRSRRSARPRKPASPP